MEFPKIVFFDVEGTLLLKHYPLDDGKVAPSAWTLLASRLGEDCLREEQESKERWNRGEYPGYVEWMKDSIEIQQRHGLTRQIFDEVIAAVPVTPGVGEALADLHADGTITAVISGGFKALADKIQRKHKISHSLCACEYFFDDNGRLEHFNLLPSDERGKVAFMRLLCDEHGIDPGQCAFVGDGKNDVALAGAVGFSIAFNAQPELCDVCTTSIAQAPGREDFSAVTAELRRWTQGRGHG